MWTGKSWNKTSQFFQLEKRTFKIKFKKLVLKFFLPEIPISCINLQESVLLISFYQSWDISKKWKTEFHILGLISKKVSFWQEIALKQKFLTRNLHFLGYLIFLFLKYSISFFVTKIPTKSF